MGDSSTWYVGFWDKVNICEDLVDLVHCMLGYETSDKLNLSLLIYYLPIVGQSSFLLWFQKC